MKKLLMIILLLNLLFLSGCSLFDVKYETKVDNCKELMTGVVSVVSSPVADATCKNKCQAEGYTFKQWECSSNDKVTCVCER